MNRSQRVGARRLDGWSTTSNAEPETGPHALPTHNPWPSELLQADASLECSRSLDETRTAPLELGASGSLTTAERVTEQI